MLKSIFSVAGSDIINRGFFFLFNIVIARTISATDFGFYSLSIAVGFWLWSVTDAGLTAHGIKILSQDESSGKIIGRIMGTRFLSLFVVAIVYLLVIFLLPISIHEASVYSIAVIYIIGMSIFPAWIARARRDNLYYALSFSAVAFIGLCLLILYLLEIIPNSSVGAITSRNAAWIIGSIIAFYVIKRGVNFESKFQIDIKVLRKTFPLGIAAILYTLIPIIPFLSIRILGWEEKLGQYGVMFQVQQVLIVGAGVFSTVLLPSVSRALKTDNDHRVKEIVMKHFSLVFVVSISVFLGYMLFGESLVVLLYGVQYQSISMFVLPFSLAIVFVYHRLSVDAILIATGKYKLMMINGFFVIALALIISGMVSTAVALAWVYMFTEMLLLLANAIVATVLFKKVK